VFKSHVDKINWLSCDNVLRKYTKRERDILTRVYSGYDTLPDEVYNASKEYKINQNFIWDLMKDVERAVAYRRELI
jgi:predicted patatin/cPLA2 family phospholipase